MNRKLALILALVVGMLFAGAASARGGFSFGYSDYGRHGGYGLSFGGYGGRSWGGFGWSSPSFGIGYGYNDRYWRDPWYVSGYRHGYYPSYRDYYPRRHYYRSHYYPRHYRSHRHHRHDRYDRYDRYDRRHHRGHGRRY